MKIYEFDNTTDFVFECDLYIDANFHCEFDTTDVESLREILLDFGITKFDVHVGMNDKLQRTVTLRVHEPLTEEFYYELTPMMLK